MFWLGIPKATWLERAHVPTMVSYRSLRGRHTFPRAQAIWTQDSSGFTEIERPPHRYTTTAADYARDTWRHAEEIGRLEWAAIQDWMCEPSMLQRTGLSIDDHQRLTTESYLDLRELEPRIPWLPVLQGWTLDDYRRHVDRYMRAGIDLLRAPVVGLGTMCRRQNTLEAVGIIRTLAQLGLRLHGFGLKVFSVLRASGLLHSSDSMAWSLDGRLPHGGRCRRARDHEQCANCLTYALLWRQRLVNRLGQQLLPGVA